MARACPAPVLGSSEVRMSSAEPGIRPRDSRGHSLVPPELRPFIRYPGFRAVPVEVPQRTLETFRHGTPTLRASESTPRALVSSSSLTGVSLGQSQYITVNF